MRARNCSLALASERSLESFTRVISLDKRNWEHVGEDGR